MNSIPCSLANLARHSIFSAPPSPKSSTLNKGKGKQDGDWQVVHKPVGNDATTDSDSDSDYQDADEVLVGSKKQRVAMRDNDLIVAVGKELRVVTITGESWGVRGDAVGSYKTLTSSHLDFAIHTILLNPTKRLLAVIGRNRLVVVILPKSGWSSGGGEIRCRSIEIDRFTFSPSSPTAITKVVWHPLGEGGQSLWVLTADGILREYDLHNPTEPAQRFSFASQTKTSKFSAIDPLSQYATSFTFSPSSQAGWGEFAAHVMMANGDIYTLCPVMPLRTTIALSKLQRLKAYLSLQGSVEEQKWLEELVKQVPQTEGPSTPSRSILSRSTAKKAKEETDAPDRNVRLHPPHLTEEGGPAPGSHKLPVRQGPARMDPAPEEAVDEIAATDLVLLSVDHSGEVAMTGDAGANESATSTKAGEGEDGVLVLAMVWSNGRVDVGLQVDGIRGSWTGQSAPTSPSFAILDVVELGNSSVASDAASIVTESSTASTLYVQNAVGAASLGLNDWIASILDDGDKLIKVERLISSRRPMEGLLAVSNMSLGSGLIALSSSGQVATIDIDDTVTPGATVPESILPKAEPTSGVDTQCLLLTSPFDFVKTLAQVKQPYEYTSSRSALLSLPSARSASNTINNDITRAIIAHISSLHKHIQAVRSESMALERHLDLQVQEYQRQLAVLKRCTEQVAELKQRNVADRVKEMEMQQKSLNERTDKVIKDMQADIKPKAGAVEKRWFKEVLDLEGKVKGKSGTSGAGKSVSLEQRVKVAREQLDALKAAQSPVQAGTKSEGDKTPEAEESETGALRPLNSLLTIRSDELKRLMEKVEALTMRVESALGDK